MENDRPKSIDGASAGAVLRLLDDASPAVRGALIAYFKEIGAAAEPFLRSAAAGGEDARADAAAWFLRELKLNDPVADFRGFIRSLNYELESGSMLLARTVSPSLDIGACCAACDEIAGRSRELLAEPCSLREKCRVLNRVLFHEYGFRAEPDDSVDPRNCLIDEVLRRRKGTPLSLCVVYLLIAGRLGLELDPVILPGRYLVGCFGPGTGRAFFVDPAEYGRFRSAEDLAHPMRGEGWPTDRGNLGPSSIRELLCRNCRSIARHYIESGQPERAPLFAGFIEEFEAAYARYEA
ncbi:MAG: transglutaminase-like domain-containing protein [Opitutaceae bacterium]